MTFAQDTSVSGQFPQRRKLRMMAQDAALKECASSRLRRLLAYNKSSNCSDVKIGNAGILSEAASKESMPRCRGPALILDIDQTGATAKLQSQTFKVARFCARGKVEAKDVEDAELDSMRA